jgi:integrase
VRYWTDAGVHGTISGFRTAAEARAKAAEIDIDQRRGDFIDPAGGKVTVAAWARRWCDALDVAPATYAQYRSLINNHILPRWGATALGELSGTGINVWASGLRRGGYADSTVVTIVKVLSMMLADAAQERLIPTNPVRAQRRGRRHHTRRREILWATPDQVVAIAVQAGELVGPWAAILVITAAWTGARWGELTGLQRHNLHLDPHRQAGRMVIDPRIGALHEVGAELFLGPPKTAESARTITLPPFLIDALDRHLQSHQHPHVFVTERHELLRRSNFARRALRPATDGNSHRPHAPVRTRPIVPGLTFHGLRHSHKTWMIADHIPDAAQARRLGHTLPDKIADIYSHIAPELDAHLLTRLQARWTAATAALSAHHRPAPPGSASPTSTYLALPATDPPTATVAG